MINEQLHEKIDAYLNGQMPAGEVASFEADIQANPELAGEVNLHRIGLLATDRLAELDMKEKFRRWRTEMETEPPPSPPPTKKPPQRISLHIFVIALLLLLAGAFWLWQYFENKLEQERNSRKQTEQALFDANLRIEELEAEVKRMQEDFQKNAPPGNGGNNNGAVVVTTPTQQAQAWAALDQAVKELRPYAKELDEEVRSAKSNTPTIENRLAEANKAIKENRMDDAEKILEGIAPTDPLYAGALKMLPYIYVHRKKYKEAVAAYQAYLDKSKDSDIDKTDWNRAVFYLADYPNHKQDFQNLLDKMLKDPDHSYHNRAVSLQKELREKGVLPK